MKPGRVLHTRDGREIGNAIITSVEDHAKLGKVAYIRTDFGNTAKLTQSELHNLFHLGDFQCVALQKGRQIGLLFEAANA